MFKKLLAIGLLCGFAHTASAIPTTWVDTYSQNSLLTAGHSVSYQHNITDNGFDIGADHIYSYSLSINLYDDQNRDGFEAAYINLPGLLGDNLYFDLSGQEFGGWSFAGAAQLESTGKLNVSIYSLWGDFFVGNSVLTVKGNSTSVPEPGTLGLMGLGLLAMAVFSRRKNEGSFNPAALGN